MKFKQKAKAQLLKWLGIKEININYGYVWTSGMELQPLSVEIDGATVLTYQTLERKYLSLLRDVERLKTKITVIGICQILVSLSFIVLCLKLS